MKAISGFIPVGIDGIALAAFALEIKNSGKAYSRYRLVSYTGGKSNVIIKNYVNSRKHLTASKYIANRPNVITLATGSRAANQAIKSGCMLTIIISASFHTMEQFMNDELTWHHFVGGIAVDVGIAVAGVAIAIGSVTMIAVGPLIAVVLIGSLLTLAANIFMDSDRLTKQVATLLTIAEANFKHNILSLQCQAIELRRDVIEVDKLINEDLGSFLRSLSGIPKKLRIN